MIAAGRGAEPLLVAGRAQGLQLRLRLLHWLGEMLGRKILLLHARLELIGPILDLLVVAAGFSGVKSCWCVSREFRTPCGTPFLVILLRSVKDS